MLNTIWMKIRIFNSCVYIFQGPIKSFIDVLNSFKKIPKLSFPVFSHFGCPKPVFPRTVFIGKYRGKTGYRPKPPTLLDVNVHNNIVQKVVGVDIWFFASNFLMNLWLQK